MEISIFCQTTSCLFKGVLMLAEIRTIYRLKRFSADKSQPHNVSLKSRMRSSEALTLLWEVVWRRGKSLKKVRRIDESRTIQSMVVVMMMMMTETESTRNLMMTDTESTRNLFHFKPTLTNLSRGRHSLTCWMRENDPTLHRRRIQVWVHLINSQIYLK